MIVVKKYWKNLDKLKKLYLKMIVMKRPILLFNIHYFAINIIIVQT